MKTYPSNYLGIVVQNNDPEYRGRVKVWVPHINSGTYNKWETTQIDRNFKFPGLNIDSDLSSIINDLKDNLPWAEYCAPLAGESTAGTYNAYADSASVSDAAFPYSLSGTSFSNSYTQYNLNKEQVGEKPGYVYEKYNIKVTDAFTDTTANKTNNVNQNGAQYRPSTYSNAAKGVFAIPNVGAHVWVFFRDGIPLYPVYMGVSLGQDDFASIFKSDDNTYQDYPQTFESVGKNIRDVQDVNTETYRNKMVINQRGAALEIINTTDRESFKITHFAGGFLELNNKYNSLFSPKNLQILTLKDKFETVKGHNNLWVSRDYDNIIQGDYYIKTGNLNQTAMNDWVTAYTKIADILSHPENSGDKDTLQSVIDTQTQALADAEAKLGFGGNLIETVTKHKSTNVGLAFSTFPSTRYHITPKPVTTFFNNNGLTTSNIQAIEYTYLDDMPGGNYTVTAGNKYNLLVGSGGIDVKTTGPVSIGGSIIAIAGKQVNIASSDDTNIDGGTNLSVISNIITLRTRNRQQVVIDDNLGVSQNVVIGGGAYIKGETYLQHVTAPVEFQVTESTILKDISVKITKGNDGPGDGTNVHYGDVITLAFSQPHTHYFKNIPLTLVTDFTTLNTQAAAVNGPHSTVTAAPVSTHYNSAGGNQNSNPNGPVNGVPGTP